MIFANSTMSKVNIYNNPNPTQSISAECMISFMLASVFKWTGRVMTKSQVDVVGLHLQSVVHPWRNWQLIFFGKPNGGNFFAPVSHCNMCSTLRFGISIQLDY